MARRERRRHERKWRKSRLHVHRQLHVAQHKLVNDMIDQAKQDYYRKELEGADPKTVFKNLNILLNKPAKTLPAYDSAQALNNNLASFFVGKVA